MEFLFALAIFVIVTISIFCYVARKYSYWERNKVPFVMPEFPYGNLNLKKENVHTALLFKKYYDQLKGRKPFGGLYIFMNPIVIALDLDFVKNVLVKDFQYFMNRGIYHNEKDDPLSANLFTIENHKWKNLRSKLTPTFTSGKMKFMFPTLIKVAEEFKNCIENELKISTEIEVKELLARFTTDIIGTCAFGLECNSLKNPNSEFRLYGKRIIKSEKSSRLTYFFKANYSNLARKLGMRLLPKDVTNFFKTVVQETVELREKEHIKRNDFMDILIQLKNNVEGVDNSLSMNEIAAQSLLFFLGGFETSSTLLSYTLYELSINQEIQNIARHEVNTVLQRNNGIFCYEAMHEMTYITQILHETLRKYPPLANLNRNVTADYKEPKTGIVIKKGMNVIIPVYGIHHDPKYYPNPEEYDPDRFGTFESKTRNPFAFLPFGEGPRNCIGLRFGMMQTQIGLVSILKNFRFSKSSKTITPLIFTKRSPLLITEEGLYLEMEKIE